MRFFKRVVLFLLICFAVPALSALGLRAASSQPQSWRDADWGSSGILASRESETDAAIYVMAARTGGLRGGLAVHSWIVLKHEGAGGFMRYDVVGWGDPVRINAYPADGLWYSNKPDILFELRGAEAARLIPQVEAAIGSYRYGGRYDYVMWPGPNSNTFVASVLREVPDIDFVLPPEAVGRDFRPWNEVVTVSPDWRNLEISLGGYGGLGLGVLHGIEIRLAGLVFGLDIARPGIKLPGFGRIGV